MIPEILRGLPIHWQGTDDTTPADCTLITTDVLGITTTYILRDGAVLGRVEMQDSGLVGYAGAGLKGGRYVGLGRNCGDLARCVVMRADND